MGATPAREYARQTRLNYADEDSPNLVAARALSVLQNQACENPERADTHNLQDTHQPVLAHDAAMRQTAKNDHDGPGTHLEPTPFACLSLHSIGSWKEGASHQSSW